MGNNDTNLKLGYREGENSSKFNDPGVNTWRPRQAGSHFPDDILEWIFLNENLWISIKFSLKFLPRRSFNNIPVMIQIMTWRPPDDKSISEPIMVSLLTHICVITTQS